MAVVPELLFFNGSSLVVLTPHGVLSMASSEALSPNPPTVRTGVLHICTQTPNTS